MKTNDVFIAGGMPNITYNPRTELGLEEALRDYLNTRYKLISITGPTKSGKTVLCRRNVDVNNQILISGGEISSENDFWSLVLDQLDYSYIDTSSAMTSSENSIEAGASIGVSLGIINVGESGGEAQKTTTETSYTRRYVANPKKEAIDKLKSLDKTLIIDDFHYIEQTIQQQIVRALKSPIFDGLNVIVLAVPHRAYDALKVETEMTGRVTQLEIGLWNDEDLAEIARKGFSALNLHSDKATIQSLAHECYGSPNLMQEFCLRLCKNHNIDETCTTTTPLLLCESEKDIFFKSISKSVTSKIAYERLARGPRQRTDRKPRALKNGASVDIYTATLLAIAHTGPKVQITIEELRTAFKRIMDNPPQSQEVARVLAQMDRIARQQHGEPVIDWSKEDNNLFISDPYFAFYLKWAI